MMLSLIVCQGCRRSRLSLFSRLLVSNFMGPLCFSCAAPDVSAASSPDVVFSDVTRLKRGLRELSYLVDNWEAKTTYCNFGEFKMDLLSAKNKDLLIDAAKNSGLLDKSKTMNVMCKRDPEVVRAFLGKTPENLVLQKADVLMKSPDSLELVEPDRIDEYIDAVEKFSTTLSAADSLAYNARQDHDSTESFPVGPFSDVGSSKSSSRYLDQTRDLVVQVRDSLAKIVDMLGIV